MAKGDSDRYQNSIDFYGGEARNTMGNLWGNLTPQYGSFVNNYNEGVGRNLDSYDEIMQRYRDFLGGSGSPFSGVGVGAGSFSAPMVSAERVALNPEWMNHVRSALGGYQNFADTGGFSEQNIQDIRARAIAPTRSVYSSAQANIDRQRALQGGYSPNYTAASAKMARDLSQQISDANVNANASIAQMVQQGKLAGLAGLSGTGLGAAGLNLQADTSNQSAALQAAMANARNSLSSRAYDLEGRGQDLSAINAMTNLYGTTPGLANTFGNQVLGAQRNMIDAQGAQNQLSLGLIGAQRDRAMIPSNFQQGLGNIGGILGLAGTGLDLWNAWRNRGTGTFNPGWAGGGPYTGGIPGTTIPGENVGFPGAGGQSYFGPGQTIGIPGASSGFNYQGGNIYNSWQDYLNRRGGNVTWQPGAGQIRPFGGY